MKSNAPLSDNDKTVREEKLRELTADLDRIRTNKISIAFHGLWWALIICCIVLVLGGGALYSLIAFDLIPMPNIVIPAGLTEVQAVWITMCIPLIGIPISIISATLRSASLKRRIAKLQN